jgi:hypothetical protein
VIRVIRETHDTPESVQTALTLAGGLNRFGEPNYRVVWGWNRLEWVGGKWTDRDNSGNPFREVIELRQVPKYFPQNRWHIERWMPPEIYGSRRAWNKQTLEREDGIFIPALGPYPSRGEYEHCFTLQGPKGEFIPLSPMAVKYIANAVEWSRESCTPTDKRMSQQRHREKEEKAWDSHADSVLNDGPAFNQRPFVTVTA